MRLEVSQGEPMHPRTELNLIHEHTVIGDEDPVMAAGYGRALKGDGAVPASADGMVCIEDLGSQNGTFVNGSRIHAATPLRSGDEVTPGMLCSARNFDLTVCMKLHKRPEKCLRAFFIGFSEKFDRFL